MNSLKRLERDSPHQASVIIRTYNEARYLPELLSALLRQEHINFDVELIVVDSGSTDETIAIAESFNARIIHIEKNEFTFGRSLNFGCRAAGGDVLVFVSGHCVPTDVNWLARLIDPVIGGVAEYAYGRQIGRDTSKFSEVQLFLKYFPAYSKILQEGFFCNNANSALRTSTWLKYGYNENLTGLEDMYLGRQIVDAGGGIAYVSDAVVYHIHDESWNQVRVRYEREAVALQEIVPDLNFGIYDFFRYFFAAVVGDIKVAIELRRVGKEFLGILCFRSMQYIGTYIGFHKKSSVSESLKYSYFYPKDLEKKIYEKKSHGCSSPNESQ